MKLSAVLVLAFILTCSCVFAATITGTVTDADGEPVQGAHVWLARTVFAREAETERIDETVTDAKGAFSLQDPEYDEIDRHARWSVAAYREGLAPDGLAYFADAKEPLELTLHPPETLSGKVLDENGKPVSNATVHLTSCIIGRYGHDYHRFGLVEPPDSGWFEVRTNASGTFSFECIPPNARVFITVTAEGYGSVSLDDVSELTVGLQQPGSMEVTTDMPEEITALKNGSLKAYGKVGADTSHDGRMNVVETCEFEEDGNAVLSELQPGTYRIAITQQPSDSYHLRSQKSIRVASGRRTTVQLEGGPTAPVTGRVVAEDTGEGIANARIHISDGIYATAGRTDDTGHFDVPCLVGDAELHVSAPDGYVSMDWDERINVAVTEEGADVSEIALEPAQTLQVLVVDEQQRPVPEAAVRLSMPDLLMPIRGNEKTDSEGTYRQAGLEKGTKVTLRASKGDLASEQVTVTAGETDEPVKLVLKEGLNAKVVARVVDETGSPVQDARVICYERTENMAHDLHCDPPGEDGTIEKDGLIPGLDYRFRVETENSDRVNTEIWTAVAGQTHDFGTITLTIHRGTLAGTVVNSDNEPVSGAMVFNRGDTPGETETITDDAGKFELTGLVEGEAYAFVEADGYEFTAGAAPTGTDDLTITLQPQTPVSVTEPPPPREPQLPEAEAHELARKLLLEAAQQTKGAGGYTRMGIIQALAKLDEQAAYEAATGEKDRVWWVNDIVARKHMPEDFDEALAVLKSDIGAYDLVRSLIQAAEKHHDEHPEIAVRCVKEALKVTPTLSIPNKQVLYSVLAAENVEDLAPELAWSVYDKYADAAMKLGGADYEAYVRGYAAEHICDRDMERAMELIDGIADADEKARHLGNIARHVAKTDPDRAFEIVEMIGSSDRDRALTAMLPFFPDHRMDDAIDAVSGIESDFYVPMAYARLAWVVPKDRVAEMIEAAQDALLKRWQSTGVSFGDSHTPQEMVRLAICARYLGYSEYEQIALRALSLRTRGAGNYVDTSLNVREDFQLAIYLAHTDEEMARHVIESGLTYAGGLEKLNPECWNYLAAAAAEVDIQWAVELLEHMPPDDPDADDLHRAQAVRAVVKRLTESPRERRMDVLTRYSDLYPVDEDW
ncbi:MAG: carboxypeptidase regulatory-like domain-containing protein [Armatimonadota bacterium]